MCDTIANMEQTQVQIIMFEEKYEDNWSVALRAQKEDIVRELKMGRRLLEAARLKEESLQNKLLQQTSAVEASEKRLYELMYDVEEIKGRYAESVGGDGQWAEKEVVIQGKLQEERARADELAELLASARERERLLEERIARAEKHGGEVVEEERLEWERERSVLVGKVASLQAEVETVKEDQERLLANKAEAQRR